MMHRWTTIGGGESSSSVLRLLAIGKTCLLLCWCCAVTTCLADSGDFDDYRFDGSLCEFYQLIEPGNRSYYLYSPGYPDQYLADDQDRECRWFAKTPSPADRLVLDCHVFDLPEVSLYIIYLPDNYCYIIMYPVDAAPLTTAVCLYRYLYYSVS